MMSGVPLETCWVFKILCNNTFFHKIASCWLFLLIDTCTEFWPNRTKRLENRGSFLLGPQVKYGDDCTDNYGTPSIMWRYPVWNVAGICQEVWQVWLKCPYAVKWSVSVIQPFSNKLTVSGRLTNELLYRVLWILVITLARWHYVTDGSCLGIRRSSLPRDEHPEDKTDPTCVLPHRFFFHLAVFRYLCINVILLQVE